MPTSTMSRPNATRVFRTAVGTIAFVLLLVWHDPASSADEPEALQRYVPTAEEPRAGFQQPQRPLRPSAPVYKDRITPHWFHANTRFWYRNDLRGGTKEFVVVDAEQGKRQPAFDHARLAAALSKATGTEYKSDRVPIGDIEFVKDDKAIRFKVDQTTWECDLASYECTKTEGESKPSQARVGWVERSDAHNSRAVGLENSAHPMEQPEDELLLNAPNLSDDGDSPQPNQPNRGRRDAGPSPKSPDGKWTAFVKDHNLYVRAEEGGKEIQLSQDGKEGLAYGFPNWAPDSRTLAAFRVEPGDRKEVFLVESSPRGGGRAKLQRRPYDLPGD